ncbi:MAG: hypothetical protein NZV14_14680 [Bryobacteraceae bacterium]|nr:hypothetical protein [Bryobacteraceae bacterium]MDW8379408.1 hypothetical protein [Bryobacterales bacterium]
MGLAAFLLGLAASCSGASVPVDRSFYRPGPVTVTEDGDLFRIHWKDELARSWIAEFTVEPRKPLIRAITLNGRTVVENAQPLYRCAVGKRRGGWDQFFDLPPSHPDGTRQFLGELAVRGVKLRTEGNRLEIAFDGFRMGIFEGAIAFTFFPGTRFLQQQALASTREPDTAYYYDAGLRMASPRSVRPGGNMEASIFFYDTNGEFRAAPGQGPERTPVAVRYRTLAAQPSEGTIAVFPPPHQYFFARDFTTNMGYLWHSVWRGHVSLGIRQLPDDNTAYYPWINAPPGSLQRMSVFYLMDDREPKALLEDVLRFTNRDQFEPLPGYQTVTTHWHFAYAVQAMNKGFDWTPPFKTVLQTMGVNAAIIMDFHGDGHPSDVTEIRLAELDALFQACRRQSDSHFLLIPAEEANVHYGGHWAVVFPKPIYWMMQRPQGTEFVSPHQKYGRVYRTGNANEMLELIRREKGFAYQTHPRTKGSTGYPDKIRSESYFLDSTYFGAGWKQMNSDLSSPRLGERALILLDDMCNWGLKKRLLAEVDVFQIDSTHELYAHMNVNYVQLPALPSFDQYGAVLEALAQGRFFLTTGEVLLPEYSLHGSDGGLRVTATVQNRFPLQFAEVVWGNKDGSTQRKIIPLTMTGPFEKKRYEWEVEAPEWRWARLAVWDIAANGAMTNPIWRQ